MVMHLCGVWELGMTGKLLLVWSLGQAYQVMDAHVDGEWTSADDWGALTYLAKSGSVYIREPTIAQRFGRGAFYI